jgi:hypothetical protein
MKGRFNEREAQGKRNSIVLGALDIELKVAISKGIGGINIPAKMARLTNFLSQE